MEIHSNMYREQSLIASITEFYNNKNNISKFLPVVEGNDISLRILDWFVTSYTKHKRTRINVNGKSFDIWSEYKSQLKSYKKEAFDPFCRLDKKKTTGITKKLIDFEYEKGKKITSTIGQLNFFRWLISSGVLDYIKEHQSEIENLMLKETIEKKKLKIQSKKKFDMSVSSPRREIVSVGSDDSAKFDVSLEDHSTKDQKKIVVKF